jgi:hypothetical protein
MSEFTTSILLTIVVILNLEAYRLNDNESRIVLTAISQIILFITLFINL